MLDRQRFFESLSKLEEQVALAGTVKVESHKRTTKTGKVVDVEAHTRSVKDMSNTDLFKEYKGLASGDTSQPQNRNRLAQVVNEIRDRKSRGEWGHARKSDASRAQNRVREEAPAKTMEAGTDDFKANQANPQPPMTDEEYDAHVAKIGSILADKSISDKYDTQKKHGIWGYQTDKNGREFYGPIPGLYKPERAEQHKKIIQDILEAHKDVPRDRKAIMSGGLGGAGKGTTLKKGEDEGGAGVDQSQYITIDPDELKGELLKRGMVDPVPGLLPMEHANYIHEESSDLANMLHEIAMDMGMNVILDTTMGSKSVDGKVKAFEDAGYDIEAVFVDVPVEVSKESALKRHRGGMDRFRAGTDELGGRYVPDFIIEKNRADDGSEYFSKNREFFETLKQDHAFARARVFQRTSAKGGATKIADEKYVPRSRKRREAEKSDPSKTTAQAMDKVQEKSEEKVAASRLSRSVEELIKLTRVI